MNQILLTENFNNKNKKQKEIKTNTNDIKKIILFFAIVIIVFGVSLSGVFGYKLYKNSKGEQINLSKPEVSLEKFENTAEAYIIAQSNMGLDKIIYSWNNEEEVIKELYGRKEQEEQIEVPDGDNTLHIKVIDLNGQVTETVEYFSIDIEKPKIETSVVNGRLKILATTENTDIKYITYKWNNEEEIKVEADSSSNKKLETIIDIKRGKNEINITAVASNKGKETVNKTFNGVNNPVIEVTKDGSRLYLKISHDLGIKKIEFELNGKQYTYDENVPSYNPDSKDIEYYFNLIEGENTVIIKATSIEETEAVYRGKCNYTAEEE